MKKDSEEDEDKSALEVSGAELELEQDRWSDDGGAQPAPNFVKLSAPDLANRWVATAWRLDGAGDTEAARVMYSKVVAEFPFTRAAVEARDWLAANPA